MKYKVIEKYFPDISPLQQQQLETLGATCADWNERINVVSRKDTDNLEVNHILHSLAIAKFLKFQPGSTVIDLGAGGGFPSLPLAILFPDVHFHLVDRVGKKLKVAGAIAEACGLTNVSLQHGDFSECKLPADFIVSRAVMPQDQLVKLARKNIKKESANALPNGLISLKGGDLTEELKNVRNNSEVVDISSYFSEPFFETKKVVYTALQ